MQCTKYLTGVERRKAPSLIKHRSPDFTCASRCFNFYELNANKIYLPFLTYLFVNNCHCCSRK